MTGHTDAMPSELQCHLCGYDLRAHPPDGKCPECGASVEESRRLAAIPRRPAWRDSDPRWRRRMLAGAWVLVLLPLMDVLLTFGWASRVPMPRVFDFRGTVRTLDETLLSYRGLYQPLVFCIGVVLLFSKERGRRRGRWDWTRRWGVICSYAVLLISATGVLFIVSLVMVGIAAIFHSMPLRYQPALTPWFSNVSTAYLGYGPHPQTAASIALVAFSCVAILLACLPLFDALRSSGPKRAAAILVAPLGLFSLMHLAQVAQYCLGFARPTSTDVTQYGMYFCPGVLVRHIADFQFGAGMSGSVVNALVEAAKWCIVFAIAVWLTIARLTAWRHSFSCPSADAP